MSLYGFNRCPAAQTSRVLCESGGEVGLLEAIDTHADPNGPLPLLSGPLLRCISASS